MNASKGGKVGIWIVVSIIVTGLLVGGVGYAWHKSNTQSIENDLQQQIETLQNQVSNLQQSSETTPKSSEIPKESIAPEATTTWKTYRNDELNFTLQLPSTASVDKVFNDEYNRLVSFKDGEEIFEVRLKEGKNISMDQYYYLDFPISSRTTLAGQPALVFEAPNGYCDGPGCGDPFIAYSTKYGDDFYNVVFYGDIKMTDEKNTILSSLQFIQ